MKAEFLISMFRERLQILFIPDPVPTLAWQAYTAPVRTFYDYPGSLWAIHAKAGLLSCRILFQKAKLLHEINF